jgi:flagellar export protein FliJ
VKAFYFRLDRILRLREDAEQAQARRYGEAARAEADLQRQCREQADYLAEIGDRITPAVGQLTNAGVLRALQLTTNAAANQLDEAERARTDAEQHAEAERAELAKARVERKSLERLKEQQQSNWREAASRQDQKEMDEIAARTRGRR